MSVLGLSRRADWIVGYRLSGGGFSRYAAAQMNISVQNNSFAWLAIGPLRFIESVADPTLYEMNLFDLQSTNLLLS
jgi:hypothetical protein